MRLEKIITLANRQVELEFRVMERSLRATGCDLPLWVIPYNDERFDLPDGAQWWESPPLFEWLAGHGTHPTMRKYLCLCTANYQFVDTDVCFLSDPRSALENERGFVTSCGHWRDTSHTLTTQSREVISRRSTNWARFVFNSGQFACDRALYELESLVSVSEDPRHIETALLLPHHEQPGLNLLVFLSNIPITNLTLPPVAMESTWAGDYEGEFAGFWSDAARTPYLMHWAGLPITGARPIDKLYLGYLASDERAEWARRGRVGAKSARPGRVRRMLRRIASSVCERDGGRTRCR